jgi:hypothetical protein
VLNEGILYCKALSKVVCPVETRSFADTTSIGKGLLVLLLTGVLDPVTTISCNAWPPSSDKTTFIIEAVVAFPLEKTNVTKKRS